MAPASKGQSFFDSKWFTLEIIGTKVVYSVNGFGKMISLYDDKAKKVMGLKCIKDIYEQTIMYDFIERTNKKEESSIIGYDGLKAIEVDLAVC